MNRIQASDGDCRLARQLAEKWFADPENLPFSFEYAGKRYHGFGPDFEVTGDSLLMTARHADNRLAVTVRMAVYAAHAAFEWTITFSNRSAEPSARLQQIKAADLVFPGKNQLLLICNSDKDNDPYSHQPQAIRLNTGTAVAFEPFGGRATNLQFPFYRLVSAEAGVFLSVGWPGQWKTRFQAQPDGVRFTAGQAVFAACLLPGEEIRTPLMSFLPHDPIADEQRAANLWRRWFIDCNMRKIRGKVMQPVLAGLTSFLYEEMRLANEENQIAAIGAYAGYDIALDYWWMDAGWYFGEGDQTLESWWTTGSWRVDTNRFPDKFRRVSDYASDVGVRTMLWFEPERVTPGTDLGCRQEWLLNGSLADLGQADCRSWIIERVDQVLTEGHISLYRQDFNIDPLPFWEWGDQQKGADRAGITENLYVQGYLAYWDELIRRHPDMMIDSCASGGRRNDLETMRRAVPVHKTDADYSNYDHKQGMHHTLYRWFPYFGTIVTGWGNPVVDDAYAFRSAFVPWMALPFDIRRADLDYAVIRRFVAEWRRIKDLFYGDYYQLTPWTNQAADWIGWLFIDPE